MQSPSFFEAYATSFHGFYWDYDFIIYVQPFIFSFMYIMFYVQEL